MSHLDKPSRPPVAALVRRRVWALRARDVRIVAAPAGIVKDVDVEVAMRDGVVLRVNVHRPEGSERTRLPVIVSAHPYGKDALPRLRRGRYRPVFQSRVFRHPQPVVCSALTGWEAPDPGYWVPRGYVVVNADLRGFGRSDGVGAPMSDQEARDVHDLVEWAGTQPWSTGKVGLDGVSYLAISQWKAAALRPPHLAAICPWEGFTDAYRDFMRPGGIREDGFSIIWAKAVKHVGRGTVDMRAEQKARPLVDDWWESLRPDLERIDVPALICASFSDHRLHSRGSFEAWRRIGSRHKWLYTHRGGKWAVYYSADAAAVRERFFDWALKGLDNGWPDQPPVRLEIRDRGDRVAAIQDIPHFPPADLGWRSLALDATTMLMTRNPPGSPGVVQVRRRRAARFRWTVPDELDLVGPASVRLHVEIPAGGDTHLFAGIRKIHAGKEVTFEGSFGFERDLVSTGLLVASARQADPALSPSAAQPVHAFRHARPLHPGEVTPVDIALLPTATRFQAGDHLVLEIATRWFFPRNPLTGQFPTWYATGQQTTIHLHTGPTAPATLLLPALPNPATS
jgi:predicted acyl esterase